MRKGFRLIINSTKQKVEKAKEGKRKKHIERKTIQSVIDAWQEAIWRRYDRETYVVSWSVKDRKLASLMLCDLGYDLVEKMIDTFVFMWDEPGLPCFSYFWLKRGSVLAIVRGQALARSGTIDVDEYNEERDGGQSKIGWE